MTDRIILKGNSKLLTPLITQIMAVHQLLEKIDVQSGNPRSQIDPGRRYRPSVRLYFMEDSSFRPGTNQPRGQGADRTDGELKFRLMNETAETISRAELTSLGQRIKNIFGANEGYLWNKGKTLYCYADWDKGYQLQMLCRTEAQAKDLVTKTLSLQGHVPTWKYMTKTGNVSEAERYPNVRQTKTILGEQVTLPLTRPNAEVRFRFADVNVHPLAHPVVVYDRTGKKVGAYVR